MKTWKRWQDWATLIPGALLLITPFVFGLATLGSRSWNAWILGTVISVASVILALIWLGLSSNKLIGGMTMVIGLTICIAPWVISGFSVTAGTMASSIVGLFLTIAAGVVSMENRTPQTYQAMQKAMIETKTPRSYQPVSNSL